MKQRFDQIVCLICGLAAAGLLACGQREPDPVPQQRGQVVDMEVEIDEGGVTKAPITGSAFANGTHLFGLAITKADGVTAYETGAGHTWSQAVISGASQTWTYKWGASAGSVLPLLFKGDPMQVAGYYPYTTAAATLAGRDDGRLNVPFDLTPTAQQADQTDWLYSVGQTVTYGTGARQSVLLPFRHVFALLEFQVKLKDATVGATITKVEVCNKSGKSFLSNKGFFSPYTGYLTASTAGVVSVTVSKVLSATGYATIQVLVPPTLLAGYLDGDIYVQMYDQGAADPKQFPILKSYLTQSGTYGFVGGGKYVFKLSYDNMGTGSLTVTSWLTTTITGTIGSGV